MTNFLHNRQNARFAFQAPVHVFVELKPWRLAITSTSLNMSAAGFLCRIAAEDMPSTLSRADLFSLIHVGNSYDVQFNHKFPYLDTPLLKARLLRVDDQLGGVTLAFAFEHQSEDLLDLIHEIEKSVRQSIG